MLIDRLRREGEVSWKADLRGQIIANRLLTSWAERVRVVKAPQYHFRLVPLSSHLNPDTPSPPSTSTTNICLFLAINLDSLTSSLPWFNPFIAAMEV